MSGSNPTDEGGLRRPFAPRPEWYQANDIKDHKISEDMQSYLNKRLKPFTNNCFDKANRSMSTFYALQTVVIVFAALIPIINVIDLGNNSSGVIRIVSAAFGGVIAASTGYIQLKKLLEAGIISRIIMARLQKEYNSFMLRAGKYSDNDDPKRDVMFVDNIENMLLGATSEYYDLFRPQHQTDNKGKGDQTDNKGKGEEDEN